MSSRSRSRRSQHPAGGGGRSASIHSMQQRQWNVQQSFPPDPRNTQMMMIQMNPWERGQMTSLSQHQNYHCHQGINGYSWDHNMSLKPPCPVHSIHGHQAQHTVASYNSKPHYCPVHGRYEDEDLVSNSGTTFTFYNIDTPVYKSKQAGKKGDCQNTWGGANDDMNTVTSQISQANTALLPSSNKVARAYSRRNSAKLANLCGLGKSIGKFGKKANPQTKQPGFFSCPKRVKLMENGECAVLDTENQTLQIFSMDGVCNKVYQFKFNIIDILIWNADCIALLYQTQIGLFNTDSFEVRSIPLLARKKNTVGGGRTQEDKDKNSGTAVVDTFQNPRAFDKIKYPKDEKTKSTKGASNSDKYLFVIGMLTEIIFYNDKGEAVKSLGKQPRQTQQPQTSGDDTSTDIHLFKRINSLVVDQRNNDIYVIDGELKMLYTFNSNDELTYVLDTNSCDVGPVCNPLGMCISPQGHLLIADTFNHRLLDVNKHLVRSLTLYSADYYPNDIAITKDGKLIVAINSEGRTFAGIKMYQYDTFLQTKKSSDEIR